MQTRYYVIGIGYDENDNITDHEQGFGDFDTYREAKELFLELMSRNRSTFFENAPDIYQLEIEIQECEENEEESSCIDVLDSWQFINPLY